MDRWNIELWQGNPVFQKGSFCKKEIIFLDDFLDEEIAVMFGNKNLLNFYTPKIKTTIYAKHDMDLLLDIHFNNPVKKETYIIFSMGTP